MGKSILFMVPYPQGKAPSQRFRFEQYLDILKDNGFTYELNSFYSDKTWMILHQEGHFVSKTFRIFFSFFIRFFQLFKSIRFDIVFIHREVTPIGPPVYEWILAKVFRKKIIYDFDDAIWLPNYSEANTSVQKLKYYTKVNRIMKWATKISAGNDYLVDYARQFNSNVVVNPTTIDTDNYHNPDLYETCYNSENKPVIGWTGTHTTAKYIDFLSPILTKLSNEFEFEFCVISNEKPIIDFSPLNFIKWNKETEIQDLMRFDIGVMPLTDDQWSKGKCGFKALQYMSLGVPAIASPVGINTSIIDQGINGFLCTTEAEWFESLHYFLSDVTNRKNMHDSARKKIVETYSVKSNTDNFVRLFDF